MPARNQLVDLVNQLRTIEQMLLDGATRNEIATAIAISPRQVSRHLDTLRILGLQTEGKATGSTGELTHVGDRSTRVFAKRLRLEHSEPG
jgi:predicted ArsR family transcriptional regulator